MASSRLGRLTEPTGSSLSLVPVVRPVILSGGSGTRLWPLSTSEVPKQFADLMDGGSLFVQTLSRGGEKAANPIVVTGTAYLPLVEEACRLAGVTLERTIVEPVGRNTAPAVIAAALISDADEVLVVLPSDHLIADTDAFISALEIAIEEAANGLIVTFGVVPSGPETGYGYIEAGDAVGGAFEVAQFKEKPDMEEAKWMVSDGGFSWNSGMFVFKAEVLLEEASRLCPELVSGVQAALGASTQAVVVLDESFAQVEKISLDHAIMEKTDRAVVVPLDVGWSDIGSYEALWGALEKDQDRNVIHGDVVAIDSTGSFISSSSRAVSVAGVHDLVIIETSDAVLVVPRSQSQMVRGFTEDLD